MNLFRTDLIYFRLILALAHLSLLISSVVIGACARPWLRVDLDMTDWGGDRLAYCNVVQLVDTGTARLTTSQRAGNSPMAIACAEKNTHEGHICKRSRCLNPQSPPRAAMLCCMTFHCATLPDIHNMHRICMRTQNSWVVKVLLPVELLHWWGPASWCIHSLHRAGFSLVL